MIQKINVSLKFILFFIVITFLPVNAQELNSEKLIQELQNSSTNIYNECIIKYDKHLNSHPDDVLIWIEKCKFIQNALYDINEDFNPNQEAFDSCSAMLIRTYPEHPDVLLYQTTLLWGDELKSIFEKAEKSLNKNPKIWSYLNRAKLYKSISDYYYYESDFKQSYDYIKKAIIFDKKYKTSLEHAKILFELKKHEQCLDILLSGSDTISEAWMLREKADLLVQLKQYSKAIELYDKIKTIDSTYIDNLKLANTFEGLKQYKLARKCIVDETLVEWRQEIALLSLLKHDMKYQNGKKCIESYNQYRNLGFQTDPLSLYRIKIFFTHPFQPWKFRDIPGVLLFLLTILLLIVIPYIWILPFYFVGYKWNFINLQKPFNSDWGLKAFWLISTGFLIASFASCIINPEILYTVFRSDTLTEQLSVENEGLSMLIFCLILCFFAFLSMYKINPKILLSEHWTLRKSILRSLGILIVFKIALGLYVRLGYHFGLSLDDIMCIDNVFFATRQDIQSMMTVYGKLLTFVLIGIIVPVYEEIIFRGVILGSVTRYSNFTIANIFQATIFSALHMNLYLFPAFFIFGIITGNMRKKSGGLMPGMVFHVGNNILATLVLLIR